VVGLDISPGLLRLARRLGKGEKKVSFIGYDGTTFPFETEMFDFVFSVGVFERIPKRLVERYLVEIQRVLKPDAKAFLYFLSHRAINTGFTTRLGSNSYFYYSQADSCSLISSSGMEVIRIITWPIADIVVATKSSSPSVSPRLS
jgi:SAM-dependent methyltransferase